MNNIFTKEPVNRKRQTELDIAKGIAIIFMVWVHVNEYYQGEQYHGGVYNTLVEFLGSPPAAPVFMILLGVGIVFSRNNSSRKLVERGFKLVAGGYLLSFVRDMIPYFIMYQQENDKEILKEGAALLWGVDILQFAGLAMIFFAIVLKYQLSNRTLFVIWCGFASLHLVVRDISFSNEAMNRIAGLFWGTNDYTWFPFLNWITFPMAGYVFGSYLIRCTDKKAFYKNVFLYSTAITIPLWIFSYMNNIQFGAFGDLWQQAYYHHDIIGNMVLVSFAFSWMSAVYFITPLVPEVVKKAFARWSRNTNAIYSVSYIILGFSLLVMEEASYAPWGVCVLAVIIFMLSDLYCILRDRVKRIEFSFAGKSELADKKYFNVDS